MKYEEIESQVRIYTYILYNCCMILRETLEYIFLEVYITKLAVPVRQWRPLPTPILVLTSPRPRPARRAR